MDFYEIIYERFEEAGGGDGEVLWTNIYVFVSLKKYLRFLSLWTI